MKDLKFNKAEGKFKVHYAYPHLKRAPHVIKVSGGRSSAYMLALLIHNNILSADRGDVVVFNNTGAEHPSTYDFLIEMKRWTEWRGIPFFLTEFCTYEAELGELWTRRKSFKMINDRPHSKSNPHGYRAEKGEVFEEMLSRGNLTPDRTKRICTNEMKVEVTKNFLSYWFSGVDGIPSLGPEDGKSHITDNDFIQSHRKYGGQKPDDVLLKRREFLKEISPTRPQQSWKDYTAVNFILPPSLKNPDEEIVNPDKLSVEKKFAVILGIRADEQQRLKDYTTLKKCRPGPHDFGKTEVKFAPLADFGITKEDVDDFWSRQDWDLGIDSMFGNCTFCFLKGERKLRRIAVEMMKSDPEGKLKGTPCDIDWWVDREKKYGLSKKEVVSEAHKGNGVDFIGFFGIHSGISYKSIKEGAEHDKEHPPLFDEPETEIACYCTD